MAIRLDELRRIGTSDVEVSPLGFGGNVLGNLYNTVDEDAALDTVAAAYESGIRLFDTAPLYGHGLSEHRMGNALRRYPRDSFVLSSKVGRLLKPHGKVPPPSWTRRREAYLPESCRSSRSSITPTRARSGRSRTAFSGWE
jgi:D-threo-aldose 1-dehydrogenase